MYIQESIQINGKNLTFETGKIAKQANGSVTVRYGDTMVLVTAVASKEAKPDIDFMPLTVDYIEKSYAAGKIPGNFFRREGRLSEREILVSRLIDRPIRPLFPEGWHFETQIIATVLSHDKEHGSDALAQIGASCALMFSDIPWDGPIGGINIGRIDGEFVANPTFSELKKSDMEINLVASKDAIVMVEGELENIDEDTLLEALYFGHKALQPILDLQIKMAEIVGKKKREFTSPETDAELAGQIDSIARVKLIEALSIKEKLPRYEALDQVKQYTMQQLGEEYAERKSEVSAILSKMKYDIVRSQIIKDKSRLDGRDLTTVRPITCEVGLIPRTHGSALFTRGETQALVTATLGYGTDNQKMDLITGEEFRNFMLHYNFPPYSVGEARPMRGPGRREIGHGNLAHRAISYVLPNADDFPYVLRVVSEIMESNGSSSMATVCGASLSLMNAGVPIKEHVAGIAMGLIEEGDEIAILTDILGDEDHLGDMDFKVAGTKTGITAVQMDIKIKGLSEDIMKKALYQAREGRLHILEIMEQTVLHSETLSKYAPKIEVIHIDTSKIKNVIGSGGKMIKSIIEKTGADISVDDSGKVLVITNDPDAAEKAKKLILGVVKNPKIGEYYEGKVVKIIDKFGAIVSFLPNSDGLIHISELANFRVENIEDVVKVGERVTIKIIDIDPKSRKIRLSKKQAENVDSNEVQQFI